MTAVRVLHLRVTGAVMASHHDRWSDATLHAKLALVALLGALVVWLGAALATRPRRAARPPRSSA